MKLLFDENLSYLLVRRLAELFPESAHVRDVGLSGKTDEEVWRLAAAHGYCIVSKDDDFRQRSFVRGHPPKVIWIRRGNCSTENIERILRFHAESILHFANDSSASLLALA